MDLPSINQTNTATIQHTIGMGTSGGSRVIYYNQLEAGWQDWFIDCLCKS
jgi:hypothetical protein